MSAVNYEYVSYEGVRVAWTPDLDGGGRGYGQQIVPVVRRLVGKVGRAYEFCAGPGFMGFSLLAHGLCESLCLSDVNPAAVAAMKTTVALNGLEDRVSVYLSDGLDAIPSHERWDLVVSNPPHFEGAQTGEWGLRACDPEWNIHRRFYAGVGRHLTPHAQCFMQENYRASSEAAFLPLLEGSGLAPVGSVMFNRQLPPEINPRLNSFYFFVTRVQHDELVWNDASLVELDIVFGDEGCQVSVDQHVTKPQVTLPANQKYHWVLSNQSGGAIDLVLSSAADREALRLRPQRTRRWQFIPTAETVLATGSGGVILTFK